MRFVLNFWSVANLNSDAEVSDTNRTGMVRIGLSMKVVLLLGSGRELLSNANVHSPVDWLEKIYYILHSCFFFSVHLEGLNPLRCTTTPIYSAAQSVTLQHGTLARSVPLPVALLDCCLQIACLFYVSGTWCGQDYSFGHVSYHHGQNWKQVWNRCVKPETSPCCGGVWKKNKKVPDNFISMPAVMYICSVPCEKLNKKIN